MPAGVPGHSCAWLCTQPHLLDKSIWHQLDSKQLINLQGCMEAVFATRYYKRGRTLSLGPLCTASPAPLDGQWVVGWGRAILCL